MDIEDLEDTYNFKFTAEMKAFLKVHPKGVKQSKEGGLRLPPWKGVLDRAPTKSIRQGDEESWCDDIREIYGIEGIDAFCGKTGDYEDDEENDEELHFWHLRLLPHIYPIASSHSGDMIGQVTRGKHKGNIIFVNHEAYHGGIECIAQLFLSEDAQEFVSENRSILKRLGYVHTPPTTDQVVGMLLHPDFDFAFCVAKSFKAFYQVLGKALAAGPR